jgi:CubicO group peptidase (beta-lactamase class C family)
MTGHGASMDLHEFGAITSVVVSRHGEIVHEQYLEGDLDTLHSTRSCAKTVLGMLVGIAIADGLIGGVDVSLGDLLTDRSIDPAKAPITIEQLLTMSSALDCNDWDEMSPGNEDLMYPSRDWAQFALDLPVRDRVGFSYCTAGVLLLGVALAATIGERLSRYAERRLFPAVGVERYRWPRTPRDEDSAAGGLMLTSRAWLNLGMLYLEGGRGAVASSWISESTRAHARIDERTQYGYLWWLRSFGGHDSYYMSGMGGNRVHVFPDLELVAVITSKNFNVPRPHDLTDRLLVDEVLARYAA